MQRTVSADTTSQRTEYGYDSQGRLITTTRYLGLRPLETVSVYNALGNVTQRIDAAGQVVTTTYDSLNRVVNTISAEGVVVTTTYDALGRSIGTVDNLGHTTSTAYDGLGRVITSTNAAGDMTTQTYNIAGERLVQTDAEGVQTAYVYDDLGRQTHMIQNWDGTDVAQLVAAPVTIDPTTDVNLITRYTYDLQGNRLAVINARGYTATQTTYDSLNRAVMVQNALLTTTQTTVYNILGQTVVMTDANGAETHYSYDGLNRVESIFYATDNETVSYGYNVGGQKTVMTDSLGTTVYDYDDLNRLIKVTDPLSETVEYLYNDNGQREALVYPDGKVVSYTYDGDNRLATITDWSLGLFTFGYDSAGRHITTTLANGVVSLNGYDKANRLTSRTYTSAEGTLLGEYLYELDQVGNKITVTETILAPNVVREIEQFLEENGQLVLEAEAGEVTAGTAHSWESETTQTGYVGDGYLRAEPDTGTRFAENDPAASTVSYRFQIDNPNDYALWLRGSATDASSDSVYVSLEGQGTSTALTGFG
ncbi:MAG: RHS repeat protein, partial [Anaerolineales bacterium]|nr:RHS repeat protein [Anaerolineales bacterium]